MVLTDRDEAGLTGLERRGLADRYKRSLADLEKRGLAGLNYRGLNGPRERLRRCGRLALILTCFMRRNGWVGGCGGNWSRLI